MCQGAPYACAQLMATTPFPYRLTIPSRSRLDCAPDWLDAVANSRP